MRVAVVAIEDLSSGLKTVHECWNTFRGAGMAPAWADIDLMKFPPKLLPTTMVVDIRTPLSESVFRYWGSKLTEIHGVEMTSRCPYDLSPPDLGRQLLADHREIIEKKIPLARHYSFLSSAGYIHSHSLIRLPLSDDGVNVNHIIVVVDYSPEAMALMRLGREKFAEVVDHLPDGKAS